MSTTENILPSTAKSSAKSQAIADTQFVQLNKQMYVPQPADLKGFDAEALARFQQKLPTFKRGTLPGEEKEEFIDANGNVIDEPMWQVAQADGGAAGGALLDGGAAGGAGGAAGGAGGAAAAGAGAAPAVAGISPLALAPAAALGGGGGPTNVAPVMSTAGACLVNPLDTPYALPDHTPDHTHDNYVHLRLSVNAQAGQLVNCDSIAALASDANHDTLKFYFLDTNHHRVSVSDNGYFAIDANTGNITLTALGANEIGLNHVDATHLNSNLFDLLNSTYELHVVAWDGSLQSNTLDIMVDRGLANNMHETNNWSVSQLMTEGYKVYEDPSNPESNFYYSNHNGGDPSAASINPTHHHEFDNHTLYVTGAIGVVQTDNGPQHTNLLDILTLDSPVAPGPSTDFTAALDHGLSLEYNSMDFHRDGGDLVISLNQTYYGYDVNGSVIHDTQSQQLDITICDQYGFALNGGTLDYVQSIEYVHFVPGATYYGYQLNDASAQDSYSCACDANFQSMFGNYLLSNIRADESNNWTIEGTSANDLIAGSESGCTPETLLGGGGNDLIFSHISGSFLDGGTGDDLLVMTGDENTISLNSDIALNGSDTVVGFDATDTFALNTGVVNAFTDFVSADQLSNFEQQIQSDVTNLFFNSSELLGKVFEFNSQDAMTSFTAMLDAALGTTDSGAAFLQAHASEMLFVFDAGVLPITQGVAVANGGGVLASLADYTGSLTADNFHLNNWAPIPV